MIKLSEIKLPKFQLNKTIAGVAMAVIAIVLLSMVCCTQYNKVKELQGENLSIKQDFKVCLTKDSIKYSEIEAKEASNKAALDFLGSDRDNWRRVATGLKAKIGVKISDVTVPVTNKPVIERIEVPVGCDSIANELYNQVAENYVPVGTTYATETKYYFIAQTLELNSLKVDSFGLAPSDISIIIGEKGFRRKPTVQIKTSNPYYSFSEGQSVVVKKKQNWWKWLLGGLAVGVTTGLLVK